MSRDDEKLPLALSLAARLLDAASIRTIGQKTPFLREMLRTHGLLGTMKMLGAITKLSNRCVERYGPRDTNVLIGFAATWNGCRFCSRGHIWAANLYHLRDTGELFALDDAEIPQLQKLSDAELLQTVRDRFAQAGLTRLAGLLERQYHLKLGEAEGSTEDDPYLAATISAWDWMIECTIVVEEKDVLPPDPIAKDQALRARYLKLRGRV